MATLNVTQSPYNAAGDGTTDDTAAIQSAIDDATATDTVYLPANTYLISKNAGGNYFLLFDDTVADDVTFEGDGYDQSILFVDGGHSTGNFLSVIDVEYGTGIVNLLLRDFGIDGNRTNNTDGMFGINSDAGGGASDGTFRNIDIYEITRIAFYIGGDGELVERCTGRDVTDFQGFGLYDGANATIKHCYSTNVGGSTFDSSGMQNPLIEDCVSDGGRCKIGGDGYSTTWRRVRINTPDGSGLTTSNTGGQGVDPSLQTITVEDVVVDGADGNGFRFASSHTWDCSTGVIIAKNCNQNAGTNSRGIYSTDTCDVLYNDARAYDTINDGPGYLSGTSGTITWGTYRHQNNAGGAGDTAVVTNNGGTVDNDTDYVGDTDDLSNVPTASEVGAGSNQTSATWETAADWDAAQSETGTHHEQPTGSDYAPSGTLEKGPPSTVLSAQTPAAFWLCHEDSGSTLNDATGNGNDLTASGTFTANVTPAPLGFSAYAFDGTDGKAITSTTVTFNQDHTWGCWVKTAETSDFAGLTVTDQDSTADTGYSQLILTDSHTGLLSGELSASLQISDGSGTTRQEDSSVPINDDVWYLVGATWDNATGTLDLWVDGAKDTATETSSAGTPDIATNPFTKGLQIAATRDDFRFLAGDFCFAFLDLGTAWTATDWDDLYQSFV